IDRLQRFLFALAKIYTVEIINGSGTINSFIRCTDRIV
ncbi:hypothetical protein Bhyg_00967, partial [Pseudolycoriella hygida]